MRPPRPMRMRPEFRFTREGRVFVLVTLGIGIGAVNTGNNLLYMVLGLLLGLLLTSGVLSEIVLRGVRVTRGRAPRAFVDAPALFELDVANDKRRFASVSFEVGDGSKDEPNETRAYVQELGPGERTTVVVERTPIRRGVLEGTHVRVTTRFPFGLIEKSRVYGAPATAMIFPALVDVHRSRDAHRDRGSDDASDRSGGGTEIIGVREKRENDSARDIHWRRTATLGRLVVRERSRERDPELHVALVCARDAGEDAARFEADVSRTASIAVDAIERGVSVRVTNERGTLGVATDRADLDRLLATLALVAPLSPDDGMRR